MSLDLIRNALIGLAVGD
jgi:ADP-ribosyl-[dinitrogen reductase] hydrolase